MFLDVPRGVVDDVLGDHDAAVLQCPARDVGVLMTHEVR
jgi:hypothetical protein